MSYTPRKEQHVYGYTIGILKFSETADGTCVAIPGCVGNASSYPFPVLYRTVNGLGFSHLYKKDRAVLPEILRAAKELEQEGVRAITGNCGFFALFQEELAETVDVPVFSSSLMQIPLIARSLRRSEKVGVITADAGHLDEEYLRAAGVDDSISVAVKGLEDKDCFQKHVLHGCGGFDFDTVCEEVARAGEELISAEPAVKAVVLECTELPPYAARLQERIQLPVFDYMTMINFMHMGVAQHPYNGFL